MPGKIPAQYPEVDAAGGNRNFIFTRGEGVRLRPGRYWISAPSNQDLEAADGAGSRARIFFKPAMWRNPGGALETGCTDWGKMKTCLGFEDDPHAGDLLFTIKGRARDKRPGGRGPGIPENKYIALQPELSQFSIIGGDMLRSVLAAVAGVVVWGLIAVALNYVIVWTVPGYAAAMPSRNFDMTMMLARLADSTVALLVAAYVTMRIARGAALASWILAGLLLVLFVPEHIHIWTQFPIWYHAYFLASLIVIPLAMARAVRS